RIHTSASTGKETVSLFALEFAMAGAVMLPPTVLLGGMFPLVVRLYGATLEGVGRAVGTVYAANTVGTILGSALAAFVGLALAGIQGSILIAITVNLILAAVLVFPRDWKPEPGVHDPSVLDWVLFGWWAYLWRREQLVYILATVWCLVAAVAIWLLAPPWN